MPLVDGAFSILVASKAILLDEEWSAGDPWMESYSLAFVIAHLDLHFATVDSGGRFSEEESVVAEREALRRMEEFMPTWSTKQ